MRRHHPALPILAILAAVFGCSRGTLPSPTPGPTATLPPGEAAAAALRQAAQRTCPASAASAGLQFSLAGPVYSFYCAPAAGHGTGALLRRFANPAAAQAAFDAARAGRAVQGFHGHPLCAWAEDDPSLPGGREEHQVWLWQAEAWLVEVRAFDDTPYPIAPDPRTVSEALYAAAVAQGLFR